MVWLVMAIVAIATGNPATRERDCEIVDYGIHDPDTPRVQFDDPTSASGERFESDDVTFIERTRVVEKAIGTGFGFQFQLHHLATTRPVHMMWRITFPKGGIRGHKKWERAFDESVPDGELLQHLLFDFDHDYELVSGTFTFDVLVDGKPKCSIAFSVR
jgi:uncharacterized protein DUF3859